jgi:hypothetical protein
MIIDDKGKLFGKINIIDLAVIVVVVVAIAGIGYKLTKSNTITPLTKTQTVLMVFEEDERPEFAIAPVKKGDVVNDKLSGITIGYVESVETGPSRTYYYNSEGQSVVSSKPGHVSYKITARCSGILTNTGITIGGTEFHINRQEQTRFGKTLLFPRITDIREIEE